MCGSAVFYGGFLRSEVDVCVFVCEYLAFFSSSSRPNPPPARPPASGIVCLPQPRFPCLSRPAAAATASPCRCSVDHGETSPTTGCSSRGRRRCSSSGALRCERTDACTCTQLSTLFWAPFFFFFVAGRQSLKLSSKGAVCSTEDFRLFLGRRVCLRGGAHACTAGSGAGVSRRELDRVHGSNNGATRHESAR